MGIPVGTDRDRAFQNRIERLGQVQDLYKSRQRETLRDLRSLALKGVLCFTLIGVVGMAIYTWRSHVTNRHPGMHGISKLERKQ